MVPSHALDYDDTHFAHVGHLSVGIYPAALAIGEMQDSSAEEVITAFLLGEAAIRVDGSWPRTLQSWLSSNGHCRSIWRDFGCRKAP